MSAKIYILEDEPLIAETIRTALIKAGYEIIGMTDNGKEALFDIEQDEPDLVLVDITLDGKMDGIEMIEHLQKKANIPFIYLTSHSDDLTLERAKKTEPDGYIVKPFNENTLKTNIELALYKNKMNRQSVSANEEFDSFFVKNKGELIKIEMENILCLEAFDNYCYLHTAEQKHLISHTLKSLEEKLPSHRFIRVHRSFIINIAKIKSLHDGYVFIDKHKIPISNSNKDELMKHIHLL
ncbi:response regulator transcription factor [Flavobacterium sp. CYK-4]|uniref:LytR/AlgR family response regulator transcription factor n=1 Tax=Flavobacterium lotistagni TaxID=2709660 RepID=UPI00140D0C68|nr:response regulator [Flavobacterium lotistagni]NHM05872.1 response regulator transcription factor [Flavobacterium lotistagni]